MKHQILVEAEVALPDALELEARLAQVIEAALQAEGAGLPCEINVLLTDHEGIQAINREMRGVDAITDVLSFPMFELTPGTPLAGADLLDPGTGLCPLGDIVLCTERAAEQAHDYGHSLEREMCYLTTHSLLHLLGYDHLDEGAQKRAMRQREKAILAQLGLGR